MLEYTCPVCGAKLFLDECNVCDVCGWEQDTLQENEPDYAGGANELSLNDFRAKWENRNR